MASKQSENVKTLEYIDIPSAIAKIKSYLLDLQHRICHFVENEDGKVKFIRDEWKHTTGGGGLSRVMVNGNVMEKAGVNFSHVYGDQLPLAASAARSLQQNSRFQALGVSVVMHPQNPYVPTSHMNVRFITIEQPNAQPLWWFGGGFDLTPYYGFTEDCIHWHKTAKQACEILDADAYLKYKQWCDSYFYLKHRKEPRGIGGLFFDDLNAPGWEACFAFMQSIGDHYIKAYQPIVARRKDLAFTERERNFQMYRRGRYVEFNLLYDRGTLFGLQSGGRTESILMSLPPKVTWHYDWHPEQGSPESVLYEKFLPCKDWI